MTILLLAIVLILFFGAAVLKNTILGLIGFLSGGALVTYLIHKSGLLAGVDFTSGVLWACSIAFLIGVVLTVRDHKSKKKAKLKRQQLDDFVSGRSYYKGD